MIKRNGFLILISFILVISFLANVYSFKNKDAVNQEYITSINELQKEIQNKNKEIDQYKKGTKDKISETKEEIVEEEKEEVIDNEKNPINNTVIKFINYAFSNDADDYVTRKSLAQNYMTEDLFDTLFSADGLNEEELIIKTRVEEVEVFLSYEDDEKLIVRYAINESKADDEYNETIVKYAIVTMEKENNEYKVSEIKAVSLDDWGI